MKLKRYSKLKMIPFSTLDHLIFYTTKNTQKLWNPKQDLNYETCYNWVQVLEGLGIKNFHEWFLKSKKTSG